MTNEVIYNADQPGLVETTKEGVPSLVAYHNHCQNSNWKKSLSQQKLGRYEIDYAVENDTHVTELDEEPHKSNLDAIIADSEFHASETCRSYFLKYAKAEKDPNKKAFALIQAEQDGEFINKERKRCIIL